MKHGPVTLRCHVQLLAVTNRVTEQLSCLTVESFYVFFNKLDDFLALLVLVINWTNM